MLNLSLKDNADSLVSFSWVFSLARLVVRPNPVNTLFVYKNYREGFSRRVGTILRHWCSMFIVWKFVVSYQERNWHIRFSFSPLVFIGNKYEFCDNTLNTQYWSWKMFIFVIWFVLFSSLLNTAPQTYCNGCYSSWLPRFLI